MSQCALCPNVNACIPPDGPSDAAILFIGEAPGRDEDKQARKHPPGRPFVGKTGDEVNRHYLPYAGLRRDSVTFVNAIQCLPVTNGGKLKADRAADMALLDCCSAHHLYSLIERLQPKVLVPLGAFACRALGLGEPFALDLRHGIPIPARENVWGIPIFPMFHPALGIHEPKKMLYIRNDWHRFRQFLLGKLRTPQDEWVGQEDYREVKHVSQLEESLDPTLPLACDTESKRGGIPFCVTGSQRAGTGWLIRAERLDLLAHLNAALARWKAKILFHNWLYDWPVTEDMGLRFPHQLIVDTMSLVFHLGNLPQGLKALALRELGMLMQDFDDLVTPYSRENVLHYYDIARLTTWPKPSEELVMDDKTGLWKLYKPQSLNTKLKRFFTDLSKRPDKDVFAMFEDNWVAEQGQIEAEIGPYPGKCISHVPFEKTLFYACRDADALIRLYPVLKQMKARVRHVSQEHWRGVA